MRLWLISNGEDVGEWDVFDSAVVAAMTYEDARNTHPYGGTIDNPELGSFRDVWATSIDNVSCVYLGEAASGMNAGVVCTSFNAG